jgi:DNA end-binding protein Ku
MSFAVSACREFAVAPRPYWKGYLKLSLVACPIAVFTATTSSERVSFRQINKQTGNRLRQQLIDDVTREVVDAADKGRGYEVDKGVYIQVDEEELEALEIESNHTIDIDSFVPRSQIDERFLDNSYYIAPSDQVGREAFAVIRDAMRGKDVVALGRIVLAKRERVIALRPWEKGLLGTTLRYAYEVRNASEYFDEIPDVKIPKDMLQLAEHILEGKAADFDPAGFVDHYEEAVVEMLKHKQAGVRVQKQKAPAPASNVVNLMDALKRSIAAEKGAGKAAPAKKAKGKSKVKQDDLRRQPEFKFAIAGGKPKQAKETAAATAGSKARPKRKSA